MRKSRLLCAGLALLLASICVQASAQPRTTYVYVWTQYTCRNRSTHKATHIYAFSSVFGICEEPPENMDSVAVAKHQEFGASQAAQTKCYGGDLNNDWWLEGMRGDGTAKVDGVRSLNIHKVIQNGDQVVDFQVPSPYSGLCR